MRVSEAWHSMLIHPVAYSLGVLTLCMVTDIINNKQMLLSLETLRVPKGA